MKQFNVNEIATYDNEKVVIGGNFTPINTTTTLGYILQVNKYGYVLWSNSYSIKNDSTSDIINVKILSNNEIYALAVYQDATPFTDIFLIRMSMYGQIISTIGLNFQNTSVTAKSLSVINSSNFIIIFSYTTQSITDGSTLYNTLVSLLSMSQINTTFGFTSSSTQFALNVVKTMNSTVFLSGIVNSKLIITQYNISSLLQSSFLNNTYFLQPSTTGYSISKSMIDMRLLYSPLIGWIISADTLSSIMAIKFNQTTLAPISTFYLTGFQQLQSIMLHIINENNTVIATFSGTNLGNRVINLVLSSNTSASVTYQNIKGSLNSPFYISLTANNQLLVLASSILKGESVTLNGTQIILLKTKTLDFSFDFNCYSVSTTTDITVQNLATSSTQASLFEQGNFVIVTPMTIILNKTITPSIVYTFAVRAESTALSSDNTNYCTVQYPIGNINNTLQVVVSSVTSPIIDLTATVSQCQGVNFTYLVLFNGSTTIPNWIIVNNTIPSVMIDPSQFTTTTDISSFSGLITTNVNTSTAYVVTTEFNTTISFINNPPTMNVTTDPSYPDSVINRLSEGFSTSFKYQVIDNEYDYLVYNMTPSEAGLSTSISYNNQTFDQYLIITWTPVKIQIGVYNFTLTYTDQYHPDSYKLLYIFLNVTQNLPPTFNNQLQNITLKEGLNYTYILPTPIDFEGEKFTVNYLGIVESTTLSSWIKYTATPNRTITITTKCGSAPVKMTPLLKLIDASGNSATENFTISITVNARPTINTIDNINMTVPIFRTPQFSSYIKDSDSTLSSLIATIIYGSSSITNQYCNNLSMDQLDNSNQVQMCLFPCPSINPNCTITNKNVSENLAYFSVVDECINNPTTSSIFYITIIQNYPPTILNPIKEILIYRGGGLTQFPIPSNFIYDKENNFTISLSVNQTQIKPDILTYDPVNYQILIKVSVIYKGSFPLNITVTDNDNQTVATNTTLVIGGCYSDRCNKCTGPNSSDCIECANGFMPDPSINQGCDQIDLNTRNEQPYSEVFVAFLIIVVFMTEILLCVYIGVSPSSLFSLMKVLQICLCLLVTEFYSPIIYLKFITCFKILRWDFKLMDFMFGPLRTTLESSVKTEYYKHLDRIGFSENSLFVDYHVSYIFLILMALGHLWIRLLNLSLNKSKSSCKGYVEKIVFTLDHGFYVKVLVSMAFMTAFLCTSEISGYNHQYGYSLSVVGSYLSLGFCIFFCIIPSVAILLLGTIHLIFNKFNKKLGISKNELENRIPGQWGHNFLRGFFSGLRNGYQHYFHLIDTIRYIIYGCIIILINDELILIATLISIQGIMLLLTVISRPFKLIIDNLLVIINESVLAIVFGIFYKFSAHPSVSSLDNYYNIEGIVIITILTISSLAVTTCSVIMHILYVVKEYRWQQNRLKIVPYSRKIDEEEKNYQDNSVDNSAIIVIPVKRDESIDNSANTKDKSDHAQDVDPYKVTALVEKPKVEQAQINIQERIKENYRNEIIKAFATKKG